MVKEVMDILKEQLKSPNLPTYKRNRLLAIVGYLNGLSTSSIATNLNLSTRSIQRFIREYKKHGLGTIQIPSKPGNKQKLTDEQIQEIRLLLQCSPSDKGYLLPTWSAALLKKYLKKVYKVNLSVESCRQLIISNNKGTRQKQSIIKQIRAFEERWNVYLSDPKIEVWVLSDLYLGIRERRKNKQGKLPYYPDDLLKDPSEIPKVDLTQKAKEEWILCLKSIKSDAFFYWHHSDQEEELPRYKDAIKKMARSTKEPTIVLLMPKFHTHIRNFQKIHINGSKKSFVVEYLPPQSSYLNPLNDLKEQVMKMFQLKKKETKVRKILSEQKVRQILTYFHKISHHE